MASPPCGERLALGDLLRQALELAAVEHGVVHHTDDQLFGGAAAETINDVFHGAHRDILARLGGAIDVGAAADFVRDVALYFQAAQHGADGRFLHRPAGGERFAAGFGGNRAVRPDVVHDHLLDFTKVAGTRIVVCSSL